MPRPLPVKPRVPIWFITQLSLFILDSFIYKIQIDPDRLKIEKLVDGQNQGTHEKGFSDLIRANEDRSFYISWSNDVIYIGPTSSYEDRYLDANYGVPIVVVEVKMYTVGAPGSWTLNNNQG